MILNSSTLVTAKDTPETSNVETEIFDRLNHTMDRHEPAFNLTAESDTPKTMNIKS